MENRKTVNIEVGLRLQIARERRGLTQEQFSEQLEITPHFLSAVERGVSGLALDKLRRACLLLGISSDYLLFGTETAENPALSTLSPQQKELVERILYDCLRLAASPPEEGAE